MSKQFVLVIIACVVGLGAIFWVTNKHNSTSSSSGNSAQLSNHIEGRGTKGVTLTEYGDYQCPACGSYYPILKQIFAKYQTQIFFQFRNFPLTQLHQNAFAGARAAEAANKQNKYWQMHDILYENQQTWSQTSNPLTLFDAYATQLGMNITKFNQDFSSSAVNDVINADINAGNKLGVDATPTFFINGQKINNPTGLAGFSTLIDQAIAQKAK